MDIRTVIDRNWDLIIVLIGYTILTIIPITCFAHNTWGSDGASYISIANYYAKGNWDDAINGYWSPLYSWLIAPFLLSGFDPFQSVIIPRALLLITGFFTIIGVNQLAKTFELEGMVKTALLVSTLPMILYFAVIYPTPDLLVTCILVFYFAVIFDCDYSNSMSHGFLSGFLGALAYFAKSFVFPFFVVHFLFSNIIYYFTGKNRKNILKNLLFGFVVFFIISGLWIGTISSKYGELTISTAKDYNHEIIGPEYQLQHPVYFLGLIKPPTENAISVWEEPSITQLDDWSPFESWEYFEFQIKILEKNIFRSFAYIEKFSSLSIIIILVSLFLIFKTESKKARIDLIKLLMTIFIYIGGYSLIFVEQRYLWPVSSLLLLTGFYLVNYFYEHKNLRFRNILLICLMFSFVVTPILELTVYASSDHPIPELSATLKNEYHIQGNIASNNNWGETVCISYYLESKYFGLTKNNSNSSTLNEELVSNNIDYYFLWGADYNLNLSSYKEITGNKIKNLKIYSKLN